jgi:hypothetical protein
VIWRAVLVAIAAVVLVAVLRQPDRAAHTAPLPLGPALDAVQRGKGDRLFVPNPTMPPEQPIPVEPTSELPKPIDGPSVRTYPNTTAVRAFRDPVCGAKGRTWFTRGNGWQYWRCNR